MRKTVLVAEDDERNRKLVRDILTVKGYQVLEAKDGAKAVELAQRETPPLIILDMQMPVLDGFEAARRLRALEATASATIWALTSFAMPEDEQKTLDAGCDVYLTKPIDVPEFLAKVERFFADLTPGRV